MNNHELKFACLKLAIKESVQGRDAIEHAKNYYDFVVGFEEIPTGIKCKEESLVIKAKNAKHIDTKDFCTWIAANI